MSLLTDARLAFGFGVRTPDPPTPPEANTTDTRSIQSYVAMDAGLLLGPNGGALVGGSPLTAATPPGASSFGSAYPPPSVPDFPAGRVSWDTSFQILGAGTYVIMPPDETMEAWRALDLDARTLKGMSATRLLRVLADASPDLSRALWDFLRLANPGWEAVAYRTGSREQHKKGQKLVDAFIDRLNDRYGSADVVIGKIHFSAFLFGMMLVELVLDENGRTALDLATPDPTSVRFEMKLDPIYGTDWVLGQYQGGVFKEIGYWPTVRYVAIDPPPGQAPYGRPPAAPALFSSLFLLGLLQDLRRVVSQQGYPRYDLAINLQRLREEMSQSLDPAQPGAFRSWVRQTIAEVQAAYTGLTPDAAFIHTDVVTVNRPTGAVSTDVLTAVDSLVRELERQLVRALKTMPLLMASGEGSSEANANRQWEIFARGIVGIQNLSASILSRLFTLLCQAEGVACTVELQYAVLRASEEYRDAQTDAQKIQNATAKWRAGWISQEEAAMEVTGHPPDQPQPREDLVTEKTYVAGVPPTTPTDTPTPPSGVVTPGGGGAPDNPDVADTKQDGEKRESYIWVRDSGGGYFRRRIQITPTAQTGTITRPAPLEPAGAPEPDTAQPTPSPAQEPVSADTEELRQLTEQVRQLVGTGSLNGNSNGHDTHQNGNGHVADLKTIVTADTPILAPPTPPASPSVPEPKTTHKVVRRDRDGRIVSVLEDDETSGRPRKVSRVINRDPNGRIVSVIEEGKDGDTPVQVEKTVRRDDEGRISEVIEKRTPLKVENTD